MECNTLLLTSSLTFPCFNAFCTSLNVNSCKLEGQTLKRLTFFPFSTSFAFGGDNVSSPPPSPGCTGGSKILWNSNASTSFLSVTQPTTPWLIISSWEILPNGNSSSTSSCPGDFLRSSSWINFSHDSCISLVAAASESVSSWRKKRSYNFPGERQKSPSLSPNNPPNPGIEESQKAWRPNSRDLL